MLKRVRVVKRSDTRRGRSKAAIKGQCRITRVISSHAVSHSALDRSDTGFHGVSWAV